MVDCGSSEGLGVEVVFLHCALAGGYLSGCESETLSVSVATSTYLSVLRLIVDTMVTSFPSSNITLQICIVQLKLFSMIGGLVNADLCVA